MLHCRYLFVALAGIALVGCAASGEKPAAVKSPSDEASPQNAVAMSKQEISEEAGIPIYPGAALPEGKSSVLADGPETRLNLVMVTTDGVKKVADYFCAKLPKLDPKVDEKSGDLMGPTPKGTLAHIRISTDGKKTTIEASAVVEKDSKS